MANRIKQIAKFLTSWFTGILSRRDIVVYTDYREDDALPTPSARNANNSGNAERESSENQSELVPNAPMKKITTTKENPQMLVGYLSSIGPIKNMGQLEIKQNPSVRIPWTLQLVHTEKGRVQVSLIEYKNALYYSSSTMTPSQFNYARANPLDKDRALSTCICLTRMNIPSNLVLKWLFPYLETFLKVNSEDGNVMLTVSSIEPYPSGALVLETNTGAYTSRTQLYSQMNIFSMEARFPSETLPESASFLNTSYWDK